MRFKYKKIDKEVDKFDREKLEETIEYLKRMLKRINSRDIGTIERLAIDLRKILIKEENENECLFLKVINDAKFPEIHSLKDLVKRGLSNMNDDEKELVLSRGINENNAIEKLNYINTFIGIDGVYKPIIKIGKVVGLSKWMDTEILLLSDDSGSHQRYTIKDLVWLIGSKDIAHINRSQCIEPIKRDDKKYKLLSNFYERFFMIIGIIECLISVYSIHYQHFNEFNFQSLDNKRGILKTYNKSKESYIIDSIFLHYDTQCLPMVIMTYYSITRESGKDRLNIMTSRAISIYIENNLLNIEVNNEIIYTSKIKQRYLDSYFNNKYRIFRDTMRYYLIMGANNMVKAETKNIYEEAVKKIDLSEKHYMIDILKYKAIAYEIDKNYGESLGIYNYIESLCYKNNLTMPLEISYRIAVCLKCSGFRNSSLANLNKIISGNITSKNLGFVEILGKALELKSMILVEEGVKGAEYFKIVNEVERINYRERSKIKRFLMNIYLNIGIAYFKHGELSKAKIYFEKSKKITKIVSKKYSVEYTERLNEYYLRKLKE